MKILDYVVCEDIRVEQGGKLSLMGVFPDKMVVRGTKDSPLVWPMNIRLACYLKVQIDTNKSISRLVASVTFNNEEFMKNDFSIPEINKKGLIVFNWNFNSKEVPAPGRFLLKISAYSQDKLIEECLEDSFEIVAG
jgi:hypothetical protein